MAESLPRIASRPSVARVLRVSGGNPRRSLAGIPLGTYGADPAISRSPPLPLTLRTQERNDELEAIPGATPCYLSLSELCLFPFLSKRLGLFVAVYGSDVNGMGRRQNGKNTLFYTDFHAILARDPTIYGGLMRQKVRRSGERKGNKRKVTWDSSLFLLEGKARSL